MSASVERRFADTAMYGGLLDGIGGIATVVLAIIGLTGLDPEWMTAIATIVFGAALLIQGGTILSEYFETLTPAETVSFEGEDGGGVPATFVAGIAGIVLGVLALLGIASMALTAIATIVFGGALILSSSSVRQLYLTQTQTLTTRSGNQLIAAQMASASAGLQLVAGLAALVLGILAVAGTAPTALNLAALLVLGVTALMTGSTLSGLVLSFMRPARAQPRPFTPGKI